MPRRRLLWQLLPPFILLSVLPLVLVLLFLYWTLRDFQLEQTRSHLLAQATLAREFIAPVAGRDREALLARVEQIAASTGARVTVIAPRGDVVADSAHVEGELNNHADRQEIILASRGRDATAHRFSHTQQRMMIYAAVPMGFVDVIGGALRLAVPAEEARPPFWDVLVRVGLFSLLLALLSGLLGNRLLKRFERRLESLRVGAERFADGDFSERVPLPATREIAAVAESLNQMARLLNERLELAVRQRNEQDAVLASMVEGVLAVDSEGRIISLNAAAARLLGAEVSRAAGQPLQTAVRNSALQRLIEDTLRTANPLEREFVLHAPEEQTLQAHGAVLRDASGERIGAVVVLHDITRLRRLERIRRDFVANVSHELRTPITAIKGFVETLLDSGLEDQATARRFLAIIEKHAERLNTIIDDLLTLSRLEIENEPLGLVLRPHLLAPLLHAAAQACQPAAAQKQIAVRVRVEEDLKALVNPPLLEQCLINLLDNAIKYSGHGSAVILDAEGREGRVLVHVGDSGCGISGEHLSRIFERFYRVDKSRSRKLGGTGLGLAIVKHIAQAHGGAVSVRSRVGEGSVFTVILRAVPLNGAP